jgi:hypothetical protein
VDEVLRIDESSLSESRRIENAWLRSQIAAGGHSIAIAIPIAIATWDAGSGPEGRGG